MKNAIKIITSAVIAVIMVAMLAVSAFAYQSALNGSCTPFTDTAKAKMAAMKDGDNIFALGSFTEASAKAFGETGNAQFVYQHNDGKWGRALKQPQWSINGMQNIGDGVYDVALGTSPANGLWFSRSTENDGLLTPDGTLDTTNGKYVTLCGWEFAADFKIKGFKVYFNKAAYVDDFDILVGKIVNDELVWEVAYSADNIASNLVDVTGCTNETVSFTADFAKTIEGRCLQFAPKTTDGMNTEAKSGHSGYVMGEFEAYWGEVKTSTTTAATTTAAPAPSTGDNSVNYVIVVVAAIAVAATAVVATRKKEND